MNRVEKSLLDTDILSEIIKRANPQIIAKADIYLSQFEKYTFISLSKNSRFRRFTNTK
jgi:tRNA(fMet)-specific endonuclease VapC